MNAEIEYVLNKLEQSYRRQRSYLAGKPRQFVSDLKHECESLRHHESHLVRVAAGINQAACEIIEEEQSRSAAGSQTSSSTNEVKS